MAQATAEAAGRSIVAPGSGAKTWRFVRRNPTLVGGLIILAGMAIIALLAPFISVDPVTMSPAQRLRPPSDANWFGTDHLGRDVYARTVYGARVSLLVGLTVAAIS